MQFLQLGSRLGRIAEEFVESTGLFRMRYGIHRAHLVVDGLESLGRLAGLRRAGHQVLVQPQLGLEAQRLGHAQHQAQADRPRLALLHRMQRTASCRHRLAKLVQGGLRQRRAQRFAILVRHVFANGQHRFRRGHFARVDLEQQRFRVVEGSVDFRRKRIVVRFKQVE